MPCANRKQFNEERTLASFVQMSRHFVCFEETRVCKQKNFRCSGDDSIRSENWRVWNVSTSQVEEPFEKQ